MRALAVTALTAFALGLGALPAHAAFPGTPRRITFVQGDVGAVAPHGIATANADGTDQRAVGPTCQGIAAPCPANPTCSRPRTHQPTSAPRTNGPLTCGTRGALTTNTVRRWLRTSWGAELATRLHARSLYPRPNSRRFTAYSAPVTSVSTSSDSPTGASL